MWRKERYVAKARETIILRTLQPETRGEAFHLSSFVTLSVRSMKKHKMKGKIGKLTCIREIL